jgi:predicted hydrocarbon binding protein
MLSSFVKKLIFARQLNIEDGSITCLEQSMTLVPTSFFLQQIDEELSFQEYKRSLIGFSRHLMRNENKLELLENYCNLFNSSGLGLIKIEGADREKRTAKVSLEHSKVAEQHLKIKGVAKEPVCALAKAFIKAMFSIIFDSGIEIKEASCLAMKHEKCIFVLSGSSQPAPKKKASSLKKPKQAQKKKPQKKQKPGKGGKKA